MPRRLIEGLRVEDVILGAWLAILVPIVTAASGGEPRFDLGSSRDPVVGLLYLAAIAGGIACLVTRGRGEPLVGDAPGTSARTFAPFPLAAAMSIVGEAAFDKLGLDGGDAIGGLAFLAVFLGYLAQARLPLLQPAVRRALMTPFVLVAAAVFQAIAADLWRDVDPLALARAQADGSLPGLGIAAILVLGTGVFYVMFVFAPRQIVEVATRGWVWLPRFALFVVGLAFGIGWLGLLGG